MVQRTRTLHHRHDITCAEMSSDGRSVHDRDPAEQLRARRAAIAREQERLQMMEMLREEDERLEREIEERERMRRR